MRISDWSSDVCSSDLAIVANSSGAEGGPLMRLATSADGSLDPRFQRMGMSLARMDALENGLKSIPQVSPAHVAYVSSSYGYRADPFTGAAAFHPGGTEERRVGKGWVRPGRTRW